MSPAVKAGLVLGLAVLLVAGAPLLASGTDEAAAKGKVRAFETGKSIAVDVGGVPKRSKVTADTPVELDVAPGKEVEVWAKDDAATRIEVQK